MTSLAFQPCEITNTHLSDMTRSDAWNQHSSAAPIFQAGAAQAASNQIYIEEIENLRRQVR